MDQHGPTASPASPRTHSRDRWVKIAFVVVTVVLVVFIYHKQRGGLSIPGWGDDLDEAMEQGRREGRLVLVLFVSDPPGTMATQLANTIRNEQNVKAVTDGRYVAVIAAVDTALKSDVARLHRLKTLPTLVLLGSAGLERNRREGMVGEVPFRQGFLDCSDVVSPSP